MAVSLTGSQLRIKQPSNDTQAFLTGISHPHTFNLKDALNEIVQTSSSAE
jgi:hypothetical protein